MKQFFFLLVLLTAIAGPTQDVKAQNCDGQRYYSIIYPAYDTTTVVYSNNNMTMDIYQPQGDTATGRKAILMIHGGNFYQGTSIDPFIYFICQRYVARGYVVASINYTLIPDSLSLEGVILDSTTAYPIIAQTISDGEAAVRYLKMNAASLGIDSSWIVIGGEASGALIADHIAYMKTQAGVTPLLDSAFAPLGGLAGNSGNPGYSTNVKAVLNFGGGLLDLNMLTPLYPVPMFTSQGDSDHTVPFGCNYPFDYYADYEVCGGGAMQPVLSSLGIINQLEAYDSLDTSPWGDTIFSGPQQGRYIQSMVDSQAALFLYQLDCPAFTAVREISEAHIGLYPNPASTTIYVDADAPMESVEIIDYTGRRISMTSTSGDRSAIDISALSSGIYLARVNLRSGSSGVRTFVVE